MTGRPARALPVLALALAVLCLVTQPGAAKPSLREVPHVEDGLFAIAVADKIRRECSSISARMLRARNTLHSLYEYARDKGYTDAEIEAYVEAEAEKDRMKLKRDAYLARLGVVKSDPESYCAAGRAEIEKASRIGVLLRAW